MEFHRFHFFQEKAFDELLFFSAKIVYIMFTDLKEVSAVDPWEMRRKKRMKRKKARALTLTLLSLVLLALALYGYLFHFGGFRVRVDLHGDQEMTLRYGDSFEDPGAEAYLQNHYLLKDGKKIDIITEGTVDEAKLGTYSITYRAKIGLWNAEATRTVHIVDKVRPRIILYGSPGTYVLPGEVYQEEGFLACDNYDGDLTDQVHISHGFNTVTYSVTDSSGNRTEVVRNIVCYDPEHPQIILEGDSEITLNAGEQFVEPGYSAMDKTDGDLTDRVKVTLNVDQYHAGTYTVTYSVKDSYGNTASASRIIKVTAFNQPETVTPEGKVIYLTFDDGPGPYTRELLDILKKYNVKATFFVVNTKYIELVEDIVKEGHSVGIHSVSHDYKSIYASEEAYFKDLYEMQGIIEDIAGVKTTLVRFPGGSSNTVSRFNKGIMTRLTQALHDLGFQYFDWNVVSGDAGETKITEEVIEFVIEGVQKQDVSIVLQHDIKDYSVDAVETIILWGLENGYRFLPLDPSSPNAHHDVRN